MLNNMRYLAVILLIILSTACATSKAGTETYQSRPGDTALINGIFLGPATETERRGGLAIRDGVIVARLETLPDNFAGKTIDLQGRYVIPGLIDLHTHSFGNQIPGPDRDSPGTSEISKRVLAAGQTAFLDLFGDEEKLFAARKEQRTDRASGADIYASLSCLTAPGGHCSEYGIPTRTMATPEEAKAAIEVLSLRAPDVIKIVYQPTDDQPSIDKPTFASAVKTAKALGLKTIIHIKTWQDIRDAVDVGATAITHVPRGAIPEDIPDLLARNGTIVIPTLAVQTEFVDYLFDPVVLDAPLARKLAPSNLISAYRDPELVNRYQDRKEEFEARNRQTLKSVGEMVKSGVTILVGTDAGNWQTIQGYSLHREMVKLVDAGMTPWQALAAATTLAGDFLNIPVGMGVGDQASLVILNRSPIEDIRNTQTIEFVVHHGKVTTD